MAIDDLLAIRTRAQLYFNGPCRCGFCNSTTHTGHPLHGLMVAVWRDLKTLLAEVEQLRSRDRWITEHADHGFACLTCGARPDTE